MSEFETHVKIQIGTEKGFGVVFAIFFSLIGMYPVLNAEGVHWWALIVALILLYLAFFAPARLSIPNKLWFKLGLLLGAIVAPIVMALVYFIVVTPTGLIVKLFGKDLLRQKLDKGSKSYWIKRTQAVGSMKDQF